MRYITVMLAVAALAACERMEQSLPTELRDSEPVTRQVTASGGIVSSPAGLSLDFPAGAVSGSHAVTLRPVPQPAAVDGRVTIGRASYEMEPADLTLGQRVRAELVLADGRDAERWLASFALERPDGTVRHLVGVNVDLSAGLARGRLETLGRLTAVVPPPESILRPSPPPGQPGALVAGAEPGAGAAVSALVLPTHVEAECGPSGPVACSEIMGYSLSGDLSDVEEHAMLDMEAELDLQAQTGSSEIWLLIGGTLRAKLGGQVESRVVYVRGAGVSGTVTGETDAFTVSGVPLEVEVDDDGEVERYHVLGDLDVTRTGASSCLVSTRIEFRHDGKDIVFEVWLTGSC